MFPLLGSQCGGPNHVSEEAHRVVERMIVDSERVLGSEHPSTLAVTDA